MNLVFKILLFSVFFSAFIPVQEIYDYAQEDLFGHNCCNDTSSESDSHNTCSSLCQCFNNPTLLNNSLSSLSLEVEFIHYHTNINKFTEGKTEPVFHPPIA